MKLPTIVAATACAIFALGACTGQAVDVANAQTSDQGESAATEAIAAALADPARADQAGDDARRQAAAALAFSGVKAGDTVIDYIPGAGYWSRIFTGIVGPEGKVYAIWPGAGDKIPQGLADLKAKNLANVTAETLAPDQPLPGNADLFWTVQNYHDIANKGGADALMAFDKRVFAALKPGGIYVVIDHAAEAGSGLRDTDTLHRIDPAIVKTQVVAAGFEFVGDSAVLAHPADDHTLKVFDPKVRGVTDEFIYKFRKPAP
ncbi:class I SAM-dependent methyltransferase [Hephaestia sp. GCM10023244]|uniref:class I SAM-dependent methyltransferase n=1 Tax=unclassified Hephaestia TaxID=2631281 RepID=UPI00207749AB|nr:methyltransferase [Hephaestia sp. MAHUQ-44]MCM8731472.1 methyltransferase [Hephaestia sp. MAHUQ-44]